MPARGLGGLGLGGVWWRGLKAVYRGKKTGWDTHAKARRREGRRRGMRAWSCEVGAGGGCRRWDRVPTGRWFFGERLPGILSRAEELRTCGASTKRPSGTGKKGHRGRWWIGFGGEGFGRWGEFKSGAARCFHRTPRCWRTGRAGSVWPNPQGVPGALGEQAETIGGRPALALKPSPGGQGAGSPLPRPSPPAKGREGVGNGAAAAGGLGYGVAASSAAGRERPIAHPLLLVG